MSISYNVISAWSRIKFSLISLLFTLTTRLILRFLRPRVNNTINSFSFKFSKRFSRGVDGFLRGFQDNQEKLMHCCGDLACEDIYEVPRPRVTRELENN